MDALAGCAHPPPAPLGYASTYWGDDGDEGDDVFIVLAIYIFFYTFSPRGLGNIVTVVIIITS